MAQCIKHPDQYRYLSPIFKDIENFYLYYSDKETSSIIIPVFDNIFKEIQNLFNYQTGFYKDIKFIDKQYKKISYTGDKKNIIVCISGGKDSLSAVLHYKKLGYNVFLYYLGNINKGYSNEVDAVRTIAEKTGFPLIIEYIKLSGNHIWTEHPCKNWIIASMALQYGIRNNIGIKVAFGNYYTSSVENEPFEVCGGDCIEMWNIYEKIIRKIIPKFRIYICNRNIQTSYNSLINNPEYIEDIISCLTPMRFRQQLREKNEKKYNIKLLPNRCGSCWKCCYEYIILCDNDLIPFNKKFYEHCLEILKQNYKKEIKNALINIDIWNYYFFYNKNRSKFYAAI